MRRHPAFQRVDHRPWPLPSRPWIGRQVWCDLLFAHWPVPASAVRPLVPEGLDIDEFDGTTWVGLVPFRMEGVSFRPLPDLPYVSAFPEMNLRLYVTRGGKAGVWFISLDATNALAVAAARRFFHLPYFRATMQVQASGEAIEYRSQRMNRGGAVTFDGTYWPTSGVQSFRPGTLEAFLTERYCLYAQAPRGTLWRTEVHHVPWPLQTAALDLRENTVTRAQDIDISGPPPLLHFSRRLDVVVYPPERT